ncbi:Uncharacterised protein [Achromobacter xylosoxidans]|nr:Uncharacterised protein [Achromobacter xylosoxidans]
MRLRLAGCRTGASGPCRPAWSIKAQDVHRQRRKFTHQIVGVELARWQPLQVQVGLELRVELLVRAVIGVQGDDGLGIERLGKQTCAPSLQGEPRFDQDLAFGLDGSLGQAQHPAQRSLNPLDLQRLLPHRHALARAGGLPDGGRVGGKTSGQRRHVGRARVPLDQPIDLGSAGLCRTARVVRLDLAHQRCGVEPRVQPCQDRRLRPEGAQALGHRNDPLEVERGLTSRVLHAGSQGQLQAEPVGTQIRRQRAVAIDPSIGAAHPILGGAAVIHGEGVHVQRQPAAGQEPVVGTCAGQQRLDERAGRLEPIARSRVQALAQRWTRRQLLDVQGPLEEGVTPEVLNGVEVALALHEQAQIAAQDVAGSHARSHGKGGIEPGQRRCQALKVMAHQRQPRHRGEVVVQLLDDQRAHRKYPVAQAQIMHQFSLRLPVHFNNNAPHPQGVDFRSEYHGSRSWKERSNRFE